MVQSFKDGLTLSDDKNLIDVDAVHRLLTDTYWANGRTKEGVSQSIENALCFGVYDGNRQIGFARVVTDFTYFAWIADIVVDPKYRGRGIGKWLTGIVVDRPEIAGCQMVLQTNDAHELYERFGFLRTEMMRRPTPIGKGGGE